MSSFEDRSQRRSRRSFPAPPTRQLRGSQPSKNGSADVRSNHTVPRVSYWALVGNGAVKADRGPEMGREETRPRQDSAGTLVLRSEPMKHWLGYAAPTFPGSQIHPAHPWDRCFCLWRPRFHSRRVGRTSRSQARHDDSHQPGDRSRIWNLARWDIGPIRY